LRFCSLEYSITSLENKFPAFQRHCFHFKTLEPTTQWWRTEDSSVLQWNLKTQTPWLLVTHYLKICISLSAASGYAMSEFCSVWTWCLCTGRN
jgi:hypothetical protein